MFNFINKNGLETKIKLRTGTKQKLYLICENEIKTRTKIFIRTKIVDFQFKKMHACKISII